MHIKNDHSTWYGMQLIIWIGIPFRVRIIWLSMQHTAGVLFTVQQMFFSWCYNVAMMCIRGLGLPQRREPRGHTCHLVFGPQSELINARADVNIRYVHIHYVVCIMSCPCWQPSKVKVHRELARERVQPSHRPLAPRPWPTHPSNDAT